MSVSEKVREALKKFGPTESEDRRIMLGALQHGRTPGNPKHVYAGTVSWQEVRHRRARNKVARRSRRVNRQRAQR